MSKVRKKNEIRKNLVLNALLQNGHLSLSGLKKYTGITHPVLSNLLTSLKKDNFVVGINCKSSISAGRPPAIVKLNSKAGFILGIDIGRLFTKYIVLDLVQNIIADIRKKSIPLSNDISVVDKLEKAFSFREAVFALSKIEELSAKIKSIRLSCIVEVVDEQMKINPKFWEKYYKGNAGEQFFDRKFSYIDRIRYYWSNKKVKESLLKLLSNLSNNKIPLALISQYLPN